MSTLARTPNPHCKHYTPQASPLHANTSCKQLYPNVLQVPMRHPTALPPSHANVPQLLYQFFASLILVIYNLQTEQAPLPAAPSTPLPTIPPHPPAKSPPTACLAPSHHTTSPFVPHSTPHHIPPHHTITVYSHHHIVPPTPPHTVTHHHASRALSARSTSLAVLRVGRSYTGL